MLGEKQNNILISWLDPYFRDSLWRVGVELSRTYSRLQRDVEVTTYGGSVQANYPLSRYWTVGTRQRLRHAKDHLDLSPSDSSEQARASLEEVKDQLEQKGLVSAFSVNLGYDSTDSAYKPHKGWRSYLEEEVAGLGGDYQFLKTTYTNAIYLPVWRYGTLKLRGDVRYLYPYGKTDRNHVPYSERFFLGGEGTVRGFKPFVVGPTVVLKTATGKDNVTSTPLGGLSSMLGSIEYSQTVLPILDVFVFVDGGSVEIGRFAIKDFHPSTGFGVRLDIGNRTPVVLGWGYPLHKEDRTKDLWQKIFFSMGGQF
jgi:outer membrane protein insertion porin family